jgi:hypothetical protein
MRASLDEVTPSLGDGSGGLMGTHGDSCSMGRKGKGREP